MESLNRTFSQFRDLFVKMSPSQRITLVLLPAMILGAFWLLMFRNNSSSYDALSWGKSFTFEEMINAERALIGAGLSDFHREGARIMVPAGEVDRYNAALLEGGGFPSDWASEMEKQFDKDSIFTSDRQSRERTKIAKAKALRRLIRGIPAIDDAEVIWTPLPGKSLRRRSSVKATVFVRPRRGHELSPTLVRALRWVVAHSVVAEMKPSDVVVFDQIKQVAYTPDQEGDPFSGRLLARINEFTDMYRSKIDEALSYIPYVLVTVNVELDKLKSSAERIHKYDKKNSVITLESEETKTQSSNQRSSRGKVGVVPNTGLALQSQAGPAKQQQLEERDLETVRVPSYTIQDKTYNAAMPQAVQVSVSIPEEYYRKAAVKEQQRLGKTEGETDAEKEAFRKTIEDSIPVIRQQVNDKVTATVAKATGVKAPDDSIAVDSYERVEPDVEEPNLSITETLSDAVSQWGGVAGLVVFSLWALWMLNKSMPKLPDEVSSESPAALPAIAEEEPEAEEKSVPETTKRDELQVVVRDNPEMAAAVLGRWIQSGN